MSHLLNALAQTVVAALATADRRTETVTGAAIDVLEFEGVALILLNTSAGTGTSPTLDVKLQHSDDGITFSDVHSGAFTQVTSAAETAGVRVMKVTISDLKRYVRVLGTIDGTTPSFDFAAEFVGIRKAS
jgi:hypothetical protein